MTRERCDRIVWDRPEALDAILHADDLLVERKGRTKELAAIDLGKHPDLADVVRQVEDALPADR